MQKAGKIDKHEQTNPFGNHLSDFTNVEVFFENSKWPLQCKWSILKGQFATFAENARSSTFKTSSSDYISRSYRLEMASNNLYR